MSSSKEKEKEQKRNPGGGVCVFGYGALYHEKLRSIVGDVKVICGALLSKHKMAWGGKSKMFSGSSIASAIPSKDGDDDLLGIVYKLNLEQLRALDVFMECYAGGLTRRVTTVVNSGHKEYPVYMYVLQESSLDRDNATVLPVYRECHKALVREACVLYRKQNN